LLAQGIELVEEDDAGGLFLRALEKGADPGGASVVVGRRREGGKERVSNWRWFLYWNDKLNK